MPRQPRFVIVGHPQHVIIRGNNRDIIFNHPNDYLFFLAKLGEAIEKYQCQLHAYVLMTNHVHLLISPETECAISKVIQAVGRSYVQYFNKKNHRTGTLWEGRYKASLIDSEMYALICYRYIELNPVRANMVMSPEDYGWSSYGFNAQGMNNNLITPHDLYCRLGTKKSERAEAYRRLFNGYFPEKQANHIRNATNQCWAIGSAEFLKNLSNKTDRPLSPSKRGGDRRSKSFNRV
jgi:putative transposase